MMENTSWPNRDQLVGILLDYMLTTRSHCLEGHCRDLEGLDQLWQQYGHLAERLQMEMLQNSAEALSADDEQLTIEHLH